MKFQRNTLLAGIAALALVAGTGIASAQDSSKGESSHGVAPHATQQMNPGGTGQSNQGAQTQERGSMSKQGQRTEDSSHATKGEKAMTGENRGQKEEQNRSAQTKEKKGTTTGNTESQAGKAAQDRDRNKNATENEQLNRSNTAQDRDHMGGKNASERNRGGNTAAEQQNRTGGGTNTSVQRDRSNTEGLQGNATGMNVQLNEKQRNEIRTTVINEHGAPRVSHVDFDVTVGTVIPRDKIHVVPVPETLVRIEPEWRGFLYFVYEDEVVIVDPNNMRIIAVVPA
jgi:hypothetical protein